MIQQSFIDYNSNSNYDFVNSNYRAANKQFDSYSYIEPSILIDIVNIKNARVDDRIKRKAISLLQSLYCGIFPKYNIDSFDGVDLDEEEGGIALCSTVRNISISIYIKVNKITIAYAGARSGILQNVNIENICFTYGAITI